jgi:hypothetical protein
VQESRLLPIMFVEMTSRHFRFFLFLGMN